jgi:hypothetical protein
MKCTSEILVLALVSEGRFWDEILLFKQVFVVVIHGRLLVLCQCIVRCYVVMRQVRPIRSFTKLCCLTKRLTPACGSYFILGNCR